MARRSRVTALSRTIALGALFTLGGPIAPGARAAIAQSTAGQSAVGALSRGLDLETAGKMREAAAAFREAYAAAGADEDSRMSAILGLERALASLGQVDSILPLLNPALRARPRDPTLRQIQLRSLHTLGRQDEVRAAFDQWRMAAPTEAAPFREYARQLLSSNRAQAADTVLRLAQRQLRGAGELALEYAELHSALGMWAQAGKSWRDAMDRLPYAEAAAVFSLQRAPAIARDSIRTALVAPPVALAPRRAASSLLLAWRQPNDAWSALEALPPNDSSLAAWREFAERAEQADAWPAARDAWIRVADAPRGGAGAAQRAAEAALRANDPRGALALLDRVRDSSAARATTLVRIEALARAGRPADAARVAADARSRLDAADQARAAALVADAWVRAGDVAQARVALAAAGEDVEGSAGGWLSLYAGDLQRARTLLKRPNDAPGADPALAITALAVLARTRTESAPDVGQAFLSAARGDTARAAEQFEAAARTLPDAASLLLATAARLREGRGDAAGALTIWQRVVSAYPTSPEAPEADLAWARALLARGDRAQAVERLEHLIITYPRSALVPIARRELERAR